MKRKNVVFILGAGASKDFGLPLGNQIFDYAYKILKLRTDAVNKTELMAVLREVEKNMRYIFTNLPKNKLAYPHFEEVLTFIWDSRKHEKMDWKRNKMILLFKNKLGAEGVFNIFVQMMGLTLDGCMLLRQSKADVGVFKKYISSLNFDKEQISFISLNYDVILDNVLLECAKEKIIKGYNYGLSFDSITNGKKNRSHYLNEHGGILLLKPHGSLNLAYCPHRYEPGFYHYEGNTFTTTADGNSNIKCPECYRVLRPLIIPPLYNKSDYIAKTGGRTSNGRRYSWRSDPDTYRKTIDPIIGKLLRTVDEIIVIGYSMPAYDFDFRNMLITNLMANIKRNKVRLKIITGGNKSPNDLKLQYKHLVGSVTIKENKGFYHYLTQAAT